MEILARIIRRYDITVIQEIRDKSDVAFDVLLDYVNNCVSPRCGPKTHHYLGITTDRYGRSVSKEQYGLIYSVNVGGLTTEFALTSTHAFERTPYCFVFNGKGAINTFSVLVTHISPRNVFNEMQYLHNISSRCMIPGGQANMIVTGDMNADCGYLSKANKDRLNFVKDANYKWLITDDMDTTLASKQCAYDSAWKSVIIFRLKWNSENSRTFKRQKDTTI
nr:unnamed protein product [Spirometra erinaceieuropaei]